MAARLRHARLRAEIVATAARMNAAGINRGTSGNVSARVPDGMLITPTGVAYDALRPQHVVAMTLDGVHRGALLPSSEWRFHAAILAARPEVGAVVHAHPSFCTTLAVLGREIPPFHYMVAKAGGDSVRCAPYATFGTQALADHALAALAGRKACLLANHGMIAVGASPRAALDLAIEVEALAEQYWRALQIGEPVLLAADEMRRVIEKFATYGQQPGRA